MTDRQRLHVIPEGTYILELREQDFKYNERTDTELIQLVWDIVDGPYAAFRLWDNLAMSVAAAARIAEYADAFGIGRDWEDVQAFLRSLHEFVGRRIRAELRTHVNQHAEQFMVIRKVLPF